MKRQAVRKYRYDIKNLIKEHYSLFLENIKELIFLFNTKGVCTFINQYAEKISHYKVNEIIGKHFSKFVAPESLRQALKAFRTSMKGKTNNPFELVVLDKNGEKLYLKTSVSLIWHKSKVAGVVGTATDITEHKETTKHLSKIVKELTLLYEIGKELTSIMEIDFLFSKILGYLRKTFGYERTGILIINERTNELAIKATTKPFADWKKNKRIKLGQGITGYVAKTGKPYLANDVSKERRYVVLDKKTKSEVAVPLKLGETVIGVINIEGYTKNAFDEDDVRILTLIANQAAIAIENSRLYKSLENSYLDTIRTLVSAMEAKDHYTYGHSERVRKYALKIAKKLKLNEQQIREVNYAGYLHDIGKIGIADSLLTKIEPLTKSEYEVIKKHPDIGHSILKDVKHLSETCEIIRSEHEKYNGTGYPNGLKNGAIPIGARIIAVADAYDAMTTNRPYRKAFSKKEAIKRLKQNSGTQFDPKIVKAFLKIIEKK